VIPYTIGNYLASVRPDTIGTDHPEVVRAESEVAERTKRLLGIRGKRTVMSIHRELGQVMWEHCGMARDRAGLEAGLRKIPALREEFWKNVNVLGDGLELNQALEQAGRVADFLELGELMCLDALEREESCGGHFRTEYQTDEGEALRNDENFCHVAVWEHQGAGTKPRRHQEPLVFENVHLATRSYK
jgi:succinate dehydrogenase / fumarate reductase flavoprotein subunit